MFGLASMSLLSLAGLSLAQDLGVPLNWRKFSNDRSDAEIIKISEAAIDAILPKLKKDTGEFDGSGYWQSGNVWCVHSPISPDGPASMANEDYRAGTTKYKDQVVGQLKNVWGLRDNYDQWGWWATAAVYAWRAYDDKDLLNNAIKTWEHISTYAISDDDAKAGKISTKDFTFKGTCNDKSMAGGVFWKTEKGSDGINSITTGLYMTLSAYLGEATGDDKYIKAAEKSLSWIRNINMKDNLALDSITAKDCKHGADWLFTYNTGKLLEGLEILVDLTDKDDYRKLAANVANAAMKTNAWHRDDGVIKEGAYPKENNDAVGFKSVLVRALDEAYNRRKGDNEALRILIHSYVCVQFNALLDLAAKGDTYSSSWTGPAQDFTTWGQMAALDVFVAAINAA
ncbi:glycoside hydrolase family 76 protein [Schizophyllum commune]